MKPKTKKPLKSFAKMTDLELAKTFLIEVKKLDELRDDELNFRCDHPNYDYWSDAEIEINNSLIGEVRSQRKVCEQIGRAIESRTV